MIPSSPLSFPPTHPLSDAKASNAGMDAPALPASPPLPPTSAERGATSPWESFIDAAGDAGSRLHSEARDAIAEGARRKATEGVDASVTAAAAVLRTVADKAGWAQRSNALKWMEAHAATAEEAMAAGCGGAALMATRTIRTESAVAGEAIAALANGVRSRADVAGTALRLIDATRGAGTSVASARETCRVAEAVVTHLALATADPAAHLAFTALRAMIERDCTPGEDTPAAVARDGIRRWGEASALDPYGWVCDTSEAASTERARFDTLAAGARVLAEARGPAYTDEADGIIASAMGNLQDAREALRDFTRRMETLESKPLREAREMHETLEAIEGDAAPRVTVEEDAVTIGGLRVPRRS